MASIISQQELIRQLADPMLAEALAVVSGCNYVVVDTREPAIWPSAPTLPACPIVGVGGDNDHVDVCVAAEHLDELVQAIDRQPVAAAALVQVLRHNAGASVQAGLLVESLTYSTLQHSAGFRAWLAARPTARADVLETSVLLMQRRANHITITLDRPHKHNAYSEQLKDALCEALQLPIADQSVEQVTIKGNGRSFCAGGDLAEFGAVTDAGEAHLSRTTRSAAPLIDKLKDKIRVEVHGACIGAGIELPAFAGTIAARADAFFQLPEVGMGLIPGAGGTVSICKRIGRRRTAYMALTDKRIDAETALRWGLIDELLA